MKWRSFAAGIAVSAVAIYFLLRSVDLSRTADAFTHVQPLWVLADLLCIALSLIVRAWRWKLLFLPDDRVSFWGATSSTLVGYTFITLLPGRVGELVRASLISQSDRVSTARAIGTIFVEKILDVLALLVILALLTFFMPLPPPVKDAGIKASLVFGAAAVVFFVLCNFPTGVVTWAEGTLDQLPILAKLRPSRLAALVLSSANGLRRLDLLVAQLLLATLFWLLAYGQLASLLRAFQLDVPWTAPALLLVTTNLGMTVPSAPAGIGVYHYIAVTTLGVFHVNESTALAYAFAAHALGYGSLTLAGVGCLIAGIARGHYRLRDVWRGQAQDEAAPAFPEQAQPKTAEPVRAV